MPAKPQAALAIGDVFVSAVRAALPYIHTDDYDDDDYDIPGYEKAEEAYPILFDVYVHAVAIKLKIASLASVVADKFSERAGWKWRLPRFAVAVKEIYIEQRESHLALKKIVLDICKARSPGLFRVRSLLLRAHRLGISSLTI